MAAARAEFEKAYSELAAKAAEDQLPEDNVEEQPETARRKRSAILPALFAISPAAFKVGYIQYPCLLVRLRYETLNKLPPSRFV